MPDFVKALSAALDIPLNNCGIPVLSLAKTRSPNALPAQYAQYVRDKKFHGGGFGILAQYARKLSPERVLFLLCHSWLIVQRATMPPSGA